MDDKENSKCSSYMLLKKKKHKSTCINVIGHLEFTCWSTTGNCCPSESAIIKGNVNLKFTPESSNIIHTHTQKKTHPNSRKFRFQWTSWLVRSTTINLAKIFEAIYLCCSLVLQNLLQTMSELIFLLPLSLVFSQTKRASKQKDRWLIIAYQRFWQLKHLNPAIYI